MSETNQWLPFFVVSGLFLGAVVALNEAFVLADKFKGKFNNLDGYGR